MEKEENLNVFASKHEPYWLSSIKREEHPGLSEDIDVDVAIVGGGITGITTGFLLKKPV